MSRQFDNPHAAASPASTKDASCLSLTGLEKKHSLDPEPKPSHGGAKPSSIAALPTPRAPPRTLSIFDYENSQVDAEPEEPVVAPKKGPAKATPAKKTRGGKTVASRVMGPPKSVRKIASEEGEGGTGGSAGGWISRKGVGAEKKGETPAAKSSKKSATAGEKLTEKAKDKKETEKEPAKALPTGKNAHASEKKGGPLQAVPVVLHSTEGGRIHPSAEPKESKEKDGEPVGGGGLTQMNWTQAFAADSESPEKMPALPSVAEEPEKRKRVKRGLFAASLMSDEERAEEEKRAKEEEEPEAEREKVEKEKAEAKKQVPA